MNKTPKKFHEINSKSVPGVNNINDWTYRIICPEDNTCQLCGLIQYCGYSTSKNGTILKIYLSGQGLTNVN